MAVIIKKKKKKKVVLRKKKVQPSKPSTRLRQPKMDKSRNWYKWNKGLNEALDKSIERGRKYVETTYHDIFGKKAPTKQHSYRAIGLKIAYHLQYLDCKEDGELDMINDKLRKRFKAASEFDILGVGHLGTIDPWGMDKPIVKRPGNAKNLTPKEKGSTRVGLEQVMVDLSNDEYELTCGEGTKGETLFRKGNRPHTVEVKASKNPLVYDLNKNWDRNALYNRLWRWHKKENLLED